VRNRWGRETWHRPRALTTALFLAGCGGIAANGADETQLPSIPKPNGVLRGGRDSNTANSSNSRRFALDSRKDNLTRVRVSAREPVGLGPTNIAGSGAVERLLAAALERASAAERWDIVAHLAHELEARRRSLNRA